uniref:Uncharacterized protein n=1 Tax=Anguilla anguilla TaxID=7936 RepID=A0A0E9V1W7_ANGAN
MSFHSVSRLHSVVYQCIRPKSGFIS